MSLMIYNSSKRELKPLAGTPSDSVNLTGEPKAPTPSTESNDTSIATTAFTKAAIAAAAPSEATTQASGLMSAADKTKLDGVATSATANAPYTSTPAANGTASAGSSDLYARGDHVHPTDTTRAPTNHQSSKTTYGIGTSSYYGHVKLSASTSSGYGTSDGYAATPSAVKSVYNLANGKPSLTSSTTPLVDGTAAVGTSSYAARADHIHPTDTSRVAVIGKGKNLLKNWYFIGGGTAGRLPINTQGKSSYVGTSGLNCWESMGNIVLNNWYTQYTGEGLNLTQTLDFDTGISILSKQVTASIVLLDSNNLYQCYSGTVTVPSPPASDWTYQAFFYETDVALILGTGANSNVAFFIQGRSSTPIKIVAVKLEVGTEQTLARLNDGGSSGYKLIDSAPNYYEELFKCTQGFIPAIGKGENLLDNWYFGCSGDALTSKFPINQIHALVDGYPRYVNLNGTISFDRWNLQGTAWLDNTWDLIMAKGSVMWQVLDTDLKRSLHGRTVTFSILYGWNAFIVTGTFTYSKNPSTDIEVANYKDPNQTTLLRLIEKTDGNLYIEAAEQIGLTAAKLELGDRQTLAHQQSDGQWFLNDPIPKYSEELSKCQRWLLTPSPGAMMEAPFLCNGWVFLPTPVTMSPQAHIYGTPATRRCSDYSTLSGVTPTVSNVGPNGITIQLVGTTEACYLEFHEGSGIVTGSD